MSLLTILFFITVGIIFSIILVIGVSSIVLNILFSNTLPNIRKFIYLSDPKSVNKLITALNE